MKNYIKAFVALAFALSCSGKSSDKTSPEPADDPTFRFSDGKEVAIAAMRSDPECKALLDPLAGKTDVVQKGEKMKALRIAIEEDESSAKHVLYCVI